MQPDILIMDKPTAVLDPKSRRNLMPILKEFSHTKIIATHDIDMIWEACDRVIIIGNGTVIADGLTKKEGCNS